MNKFASNLKFYRKRNNLAQWHLAMLLKCDRSTISAYETGKRECDFDTLIKIAKILNISTDNLLYDRREED